MPPEIKTKFISNLQNSEDCNNSFKENSLPIATDYRD